MSDWNEPQALLCPVDGARTVVHLQSHRRRSSRTAPSRSLLLFLPSSGSAPPAASSHCACDGWWSAGRWRLLQVVTRKRSGWAAFREWPALAVRESGFCLRWKIWKSCLGNRGPGGSLLRPARLWALTWVGGLGRLRWTWGQRPSWALGRISPPRGHLTHMTWNPKTVKTLVAGKRARSEPSQSCTRH